jgi:hypothetical protein
MEQRFGLPVLDWLAGIRTASSRLLLDSPMAAGPEPLPEAPL